MRAVIRAVVVLVALAGPAGAAEPVSQTFPVPVERAWTTTLAVLKHLGWDIDKEDRAIGWITTDSRRVGGGGEGRTTITLERSVFKRERILWMDSDEPLTTTDQTVEKAVLSAIGKSL